MTLKDRLILISDLAYRLRQVDGSEGASWDASKNLTIGKALDAEIKALRDKLNEPYTKKPEIARGRKKERFGLQVTKSFPEGPPQRENYHNDDDCFHAELKYAAEWRKEFECPGCTDLCCPQCGSK